MAVIYFEYKRNNYFHLICLASLGLWTFRCTGQTPQPNVLSDNKLHGLFLWIYASPWTSLNKIIDVTTDIQNLATKVARGSASCPPDSVNKSRVIPPPPDTCLQNEITVGVGYGYELYKQITNNSNLEDFTLKDRSGALGELPATDGDIFVHAKCDDRGTLFELTRIIVQQLNDKNENAPPINFEDVYGYVYKDSRDLSGFIDGTENLKNMDKRRRHVLDQDGGSYCITQKWRHDMNFIYSQSVETLEGFIGRRMNDSKELDPKLATSHVSSMTSGPQFNASKPVQMYRQSMPYGRLTSNDCGLFFIGFANSVNNFEYFLNRMTPTMDSSAPIDGDHVMKFSRCLSGNYWYFPSTEKLHEIRSYNGRVGYDRKFRCDVYNGNFYNGDSCSSSDAQRIESMKMNMLLAPTALFLVVYISTNSYF